MNVSEDKAKDYILGYTCSNDVTARKIQGLKGGNQWVRSKVGFMKFQFNTHIHMIDSFSTICNLSFL